MAGSGNRLAAGRFWAANRAIPNASMASVLVRCSASAAERRGLVNRVVPDAELDAAVDDWARRLAAKPEWALHMTKSQFQAYGRAAALGDVTTMDGDLLRSASAEDPTRFGWRPKDGSG